MSHNPIQEIAIDIFNDCPNVTPGIFCTIKAAALDSGCRYGLTISKRNPENV